MVEHLPFKQRVEGSIPSTLTILNRSAVGQILKGFDDIKTQRVLTYIHNTDAPLAQLGRAADS